MFTAQLHPAPLPPLSQMSTNITSPSGDNLNLNELRKRRGSYPQLGSKNEILSAEMLAPLPQGNVSRTISREFGDDETKPLLKVKRNYFEIVYCF